MTLFILYLQVNAIAVPQIKHSLFLPGVFISLCSSRSVSRHKTSVIETVNTQIIKTQ